uniref:Uncharacterized protein n=1 Tax=Oryza sativa subsp. japonica TaxID=39947 RepID=Q69X46_ORYSJ|nr:hypothetical protein [Oryza sativa Japonica Group]BAD35505.1 hypothetical protein [Oryza sativa Japonica Group]
MNACCLCLTDGTEVKSRMPGDRSRHSDATYYIPAYSPISARPQLHAGVDPMRMMHRRAILRPASCYAVSGMYEAASAFRWLSQPNAHARTSSSSIAYLSARTPPPLWAIGSRARILPCRAKYFDFGICIGRFSQEATTVTLFVNVVLPMAIPIHGLIAIGQQKEKEINSKD